MSNHIFFRCIQSVLMSMNTHSIPSGCMEHLEGWEGFDSSQRNMFRVNKPDDLARKQRPLLVRVYSENDTLNIDDFAEEVLPDGFHVVDMEESTVDDLNTRERLLHEEAIEFIRRAEESLEPQFRFKRRGRTSVQKKIEITAEKVALSQ